MDWLLGNGSDFLLQLLGFMLIIYIFYKLAGLVQKGIERALNKSGANVSQLLRRMILSSSHNLVIALGVLIALAQIGVSLGPLLAGLGIAGFIIGFALQDSLSNFASGMMILFYRPFDVGDMIEVTSASGTVSHMSLVNTTILTVDNKSLVVPNNIIWQGIITNVTARRSRRIDLVFGVGYDADLEQVEKILLDIVEADERILKSPEPVIKVGSLGESSVNMICRPWVKTADYWNVLWDLNKTVKQTFDREGIGFPFPQRDIHVYQHDLTSDRD
jgi:small conductance mechanosensitive channel